MYIDRCLHCALPFHHTMRRRKARGLDTSCYSKLNRRGILDFYPRLRRTTEETAVEADRLERLGLSRAEVVDALDVKTYDAVSLARRRVKRGKR